MSAQIVALVCAVLAFFFGVIAFFGAREVNRLRKEIADLQKSHKEKLKEEEDKQEKLVFALQEEQGVYKASLMLIELLLTYEPGEWRTPNTDQERVLISRIKINASGLIQISQGQVRLKR